jgi:hypothetical protein
LSAAQAAENGGPSVCGAGNATNQRFPKLATPTPYSGFWRNGGRQLLRYFLNKHMQICACMQVTGHQIFLAGHK